jgi:hypothetical protein
MFERLGGALQALAEVITLCERGGFTLVEPNVYSAEIGALDGYTAKNGTYRLQPLSFYFNTDPIRSFHPKYTTLAEFKQLAGTEIFNTGLYAPIDVLVYISYADRFAPNYTTMEPYQGIEGTMDCSGLWEPLLAKSALPVVRLPSGQVAVGGFMYNRLVCVSLASELHAVLEALYATIEAPAGPPSIAIHEYARLQGPRHLAWLAQHGPKFNNSILTANIGEQLAKEIDEYKQSALDPEKGYAAIQFRGGSFFRATPELMESKDLLAAVRQRSEQLYKCSAQLLELVKATMSANSSVYFASDFVTVPEVFPLAVLNTIMKETFREVLKMFQEALGSKLVGGDLDALPSMALDPVGVSTIADFKLAVDATEFFYAELDRTGVIKGSMYTTLILQSRESKGKTSNKVLCNSSPDP